MTFRGGTIRWRTRSRVGAVTVAMSLLIGSAVAGGSGDADYATPVAAARSLYTAVQAQDGPAIERAFYAPRPEDRDLAKAFADLIVSGKKLADAAKAKYGTTGEAIGGGTMGAEALARLDQAEVKSTGPDTATLTVPGQPKPVPMHRTPDGKWQVVIAEYAGAADADLPRQAALVRKVADALTESAGEIDAGKYPTPQAAESAIQTRLARVMIRAATQAAASTRATATRPTTTTTKP